MAMSENGIVPLVTITCVTYNQESYIARALEGIVMQKTDFPFIAVVHDDASTDRTADIVREYARKYPDIIKPIYETENQWSKKDGSLRRIIYNSVPKETKYIACCDGDDYWIDPLKLQRQVDFLEANPEYGLVHTNFIALYNDTGKKIHNAATKRYRITEGDVFEDLFKGCFIKALTVCYRAIYEFSLPELPEGTFDADLYLFFEIALHSKIHFDDYESGVYRELRESWAHSKNEQKIFEVFNSLRKLDYFYADRGHISDHIRRRLDKKWFVWDMKYYLRNGLYDKFKILNNENYICCRKGEILLYTIYILSKNSFFFKLISILLKYKLKIKKFYYYR